MFGLSNKALLVIAIVVIVGAWWWFTRGAAAMGGGSMPNVSTERGDTSETPIYARRVLL